MVPFKRVAIPCRSRTHAHAAPTAPRARPLPRPGGKETRRWDIFIGRRGGVAKTARGAHPSSVIETSVSLRRIDRACYPHRCDAHRHTVTHQKERHIFSHPPGPPNALDESHKKASAQQAARRTGVLARCQPRRICARAAGGGGSAAHQGPRPLCRPPSRSLAGASWRGTPWPTLPEHIPPSPPHANRRT